MNMKRNGGMPTGDVPGELPESTEHLEGHGASQAEMKRGFKRSSPASDGMDAFAFEGDGGFLGRPFGFER